MKFHRMGKQGFGLVELIVVIAIMVVLITMLVPSVVGYVKRAQKVRFEADARTLMTAAQSAVVLARADQEVAFRYAVKYNYNGTPMGRFTDMSLAEYITDGGYDPNAVNQARSKKVDMYIAKDMLETFPAAKGYEYETNILGKSTLEVSENPDVYGTFAFAFAYSPEGSLIYFYAVRDGYCFYMNMVEDHPETEVVEVSEDFRIPSYPNTADKIPEALAGGW